tara:strand:+ start:59 stop:1507 length:1449 start_codon:yes stop_codon:yes gene_type:complete
MLGSIRKFSSSIFAKIFLFLVAIPFVFWGMGDVFKSGNQNTIAIIDDKKISSKDFIEYVNYSTEPSEKLNENLLRKKLSDFIGNKLIQMEVEDLQIYLSKNSLRKIIKNEKIFKKDGNFSRTKYEKFLVTNGLSAVIFEKNMSDQSKKKQLLDFISGGILPAHFLIDINYNKINQKRDLQIININNIIDKKINFSEKQIIDYYNKNKKNYIYPYKTINFLEINPLNLTGADEFGDLFFEKIDKIDDYIVEGRSLSFILKEFNLNSVDKITFNKEAQNKKGQTIKNFPAELIKNIFSQDQMTKTVLTVHNDRYFIFEILKTEDVQKKADDPIVKNNVIENLKKTKSKKFITNIINKINSDQFDKLEFDNLSRIENVEIQKISLEDQNDSSVLSESLIQQIYTYPEKKVTLVADIGLSEAYLVYIEKIENVSISKESQDYKKYSNLSKVKMISSLYNSYDLYLNKKYEVEINYRAFDNIKNNIQ